MGIVVKHSFWNLFSTIIGVVLGAINVLVLYVYFLDKEYFGLSQYILSAAFLIFPVLSFGIHNAIVKFYSSFTSKLERDAFLTRMLLLPLAVIIPVSVLMTVFYQEIALLLSKKNALVYDFVWVIGIIGAAQAYFEIFYAWVKVHMKTIGGNFLKEVFYRVGVSIGLALVALEIINDVQFILLLVPIYVMRTLAMMLLALKTYRPRLSLTYNLRLREVYQYSLLMVLAGAVGTAMIDLDKTMINQYLTIENISYYGVAAYVSTLVAIPVRAMSQILHPLTSKLYNAQDFKGIEDLYKKSSLNLSIVGGLILLLILCNLHQFYDLQPEGYSLAIPVVFFIALVKYSENLLGSNNAILYNTNLYKITLWLGLGLAVLAFFLNSWLIPIYGLSGAAIATFVAFMSYSLAKVLTVYTQLRIHPWTIKTSQVLVLILLLFAVFYFWDFPFHPIINIAIKSILLVMAYGIAIIRFKMSTELLELWKLALVRLRLSKS
ncbi:MAG: oligosaccharide flippase family protein [Nonlabens sp.]